MRAMHPVLRPSACCQAASRISRAIPTSSPRAHRWQLANPFIHCSSITGRTSTSSPTTPRGALPRCTAKRVPLLSTQCHARCEDFTHMREELDNIHRPSVLAPSRVVPHGAADTLVCRSLWGWQHRHSLHVCPRLMSPVLCPPPCIYPHLCRRCGPLCPASGSLTSHLANNNSSHLAADTSSATTLESATSFPHRPSVIGKTPMFLLRRTSIHRGR